jgi:hypothetical protein
MRRKPVLAATFMVAKTIRIKIKCQTGALEESVGNEIDEQQLPQVPAASC